jgi:hypothetical protein
MAFAQAMLGPGLVDFQAAVLRLPGVPFEDVFRHLQTIEVAAGRSLNLPGYTEPLSILGMERAHE